MIAACEYCGKFKCTRIDCPNHGEYLRSEIKEAKSQLPFLERELKMWEGGKTFEGKPLPEMLEKGAQGKLRTKCERCGTEYKYNPKEKQWWGQPDGTTGGILCALIRQSRVRDDYAWG